jgi:non-canonical purine NTP pyrophosphatase (RdgB/HAM1 family)
MGGFCYNKTMITFITGNHNKLSEIAHVLTVPLAHADIDLPEIQTLDVKEVIAAKLTEARGHIKEGAILVDDSGYYFHALGKLPGVFSKFFLKEIGLEKTAHMLTLLNNVNATAYTMLGYMDAHDVVHYFEGAVEGTIVTPRGEGGFGFDPVFMPSGHTKTFAEMSESERLNLKMRAIATRKLKEFLKV